MASPSLSLPEKTTDYASFNGVKGLLILLVVFGHMYATQHSLRGVYDLIYIFHVAAFLMLPFLQSSSKLSHTFAARRFVRYAVPFFWFYTLATCLFYVLYLAPQGVTLVQSLGLYLKGLLLANTPLLDAASGLKLFWFLPALFTLVCLRAAWVNLSPINRMLLLGISLTVNLLAGSLTPYHAYIPWGLNIALFIFPLGLAAASCINYLRRQTSYVQDALLILLALLLLTLSYQLHLVTNIGDFTLYSIITNPGLLFIHQATLLTTTIGIIRLASLWNTIPGLTFIGSLSLPIYLTHSFINQGLTRLLLPYYPIQTPSGLWLQFSLVMILSIVISWILVNWSLTTRILFPRRLKDVHQTLANLLHRP